MHQRGALSSSSTSSSTMTTIKKGSKNEQQSYMKIAAIVTILIIAAVGLYSTTGGDTHAPKLAQVRSSSKVVDTADAVSKAGEESVPAAEEGRLITFELGALKDGATGTVTIQTHPSWAPIGVAQFHELVDTGFFDGCRFFRVLPNFMVQFGISGDPDKQKKWRGKVLKDDPVLTSNKRGTLTFATSGPNSRTSQMFINTNTKGNKFLDGQGFAPIGEVVSGMEYVDLINDEYREKPGQGKIQNEGNKYLEAEFPRLSHIVSSKGS